MDIFVEQLVKKKRKAVDYATVALVIMIGLILAGLSVLLVIMFAPFMLILSFIVVFAFIYLAIFVAQGTNLEFEYSVTNEYLVIDKIIAKKRRKNLVDIKISTIENFCKFTDPKLQSIKINKNINKIFPKIKRWTNITSVIATPFAISSALANNTKLAITGSVFAGASTIANELMKYYENKNKWVGFINNTHNNTL